MNRYRLLDLFCCQGGAAKGYEASGLFDVVGVDIEPQPRYPFKFVQGDALEYIAEHGHEFDFIHASPPCQAYSGLTPKKNKPDHERLIGETRNELMATGKPFVIENVAGAKDQLRFPFLLCGSMFGLRTQRHRYFETSFPVDGPALPQCDHSQIPLLVTTASAASRKRRSALGMAPKTVRNAPLAYGIDWMTADGLKECIPPAYTKWIAEQWDCMPFAPGGRALAALKKAQENPNG